MFRVFLISLLVASATGWGALAIAPFRAFSMRFFDTIVGASAGVMVGAATISLLVPAFDVGGPWEVGGGFLAGLAVMHLVSRYIPHVHERFGGGELSALRRQGILIAVTIIIHNLPEGLAVGVGYGSGRPSIAFVVAAAIALQNLPEGIAVAVPLRQSGVSRFWSVTIGALSGLPEPLGAILGFGVTDLVGASLPFALAFASAAMLYVVSHEMIPESHSHGHEDAATLAFLTGFAAIALLQNLLG